MFTRFLQLVVDRKKVGVELSAVWCELISQQKSQGKNAGGRNKVETEKRCSFESDISCSFSVDLETHDGQKW